MLLDNGDKGGMMVSQFFLSLILAVLNGLLLGILSFVFEDAPSIFKWEN